MYYNNTDNKKIYIIGAIIGVLLISAVIAIIVMSNGNNGLSSEIKAHNQEIASYAVPEGKGSVVYSMLEEVLRYNQNVSNPNLRVSFKIKSDMVIPDDQAIDLLNPPNYTEMVNADKIVSVTRYIGEAIYSDDGYITTIMYTKR